MGRKRRRRSPEEQFEMLQRLGQELEGLRGNLDRGLRKWRAAQELDAESREDLYDVLRLCTIRSQEHIRTIQSRHGRFWTNFRQEHALKVGPVRNALAHGADVSNAALDRLVEDVIRPLHEALRWTTIATWDGGAWRADFYRPDGEDWPEKRPFAAISVKDGEPHIWLVELPADDDGLTRKVRIRSSHAVSAHVSLTARRSCPSP